MKKLMKFFLILICACSVTACGKTSFEKESKKFESISEYKNTLNKEIEQSEYSDNSLGLVGEIETNSDEKYELYHCWPTKILEFIFLKIKRMAQ